MNRMDYPIHRCRQAGIFVWLAAVVRFLRADEETFTPGKIPGASRAQWLQEMRALESAPKETRLRQHAFYLDPNLQDLKLRFVEQLLAHLNPYSGHSYVADDGIMLYLDDESHFLSRASSVMAGQREWPPYMRRLLDWHVAEHGGGHKAVFLMAQDWLGRMYTAAKVSAPRILANTTTTGKPSVQDIVLACQGDFCTHGGGGAGPGEPNLHAPPQFSKGPHSRELRLAGKPWVMYTAHAFKHSAERVYWPVTLAALAAFQDADGVFFWFWAQTPVKVEGSGESSGKLRFDLAADPELYPQLRLASLIFRNRYLPVANVTYEIDFGPAALAALNSGYSGATMPVIAEPVRRR